ncbi:MAG: hypothetical protein HYU41_28585 [Candidatus Rokubacteria bacterium]|nr:hypothetical protein [Candidatus Rokubacteria bacterium]
MTPRVRAAATIVVALAALAIGACGKRGAPVAPEQRLPGPVSAFDATVRPHGIELTWTNPNRRADGTPLRDLQAVHVYRAEDSTTGEPKPALLRRGRIAGYTEVATIRVAEPAPAVASGDRVTLVDTRGLTPGRGYTYVVLTEDSTGRISVPSQRLSLRFVAAPEPPRNLSAEAGEGEARVSWTAPAQLVDGSALSGEILYEVFRAAGAEEGLAPLPGPPTPTTRIVDRAVENDRRYDYAVRAIRIDGRTKAVSELTARVPVTPVDMTAPSPPTELVAIPSAATVRLSWKPSPETDVARYVIYRSTRGGAWERAGSVTPPATTFVDREVPSGPWRYAVTAEDAGSRRNESRRSNEVTVSVP